MAMLHDLPMLEQAAAIRRGEVSPSELVEHYLKRIDRCNDDVGAYVTVRPELARAQALQAERQLTAHRGDTELPPLLGIPVAIKDLTDVAGLPCMLGSAAFRDRLPTADAHVVTLLKRAGAVILGKTNTPEFGLPCYTESDVAPPARTPWNLAYSAGGSSGGAAAAVAAGLASFAHGNDGGGSIRIPASACGVVGLKVSRGRISNGPLGGDITGLAWHGPLARTVLDAAAFLDATALPMPGDPHWAPPLTSGESFVSAAHRAPGRLRIARYARPVIIDTEVHPACLAAYERATNVLGELGHVVEDVSAPDGAPLVAAFEQVWAVAAAAVPVDDESKLRPLTRWLRDQGRRVSGPDFATALAALQLATRRLAADFARYDAVLTPTLAQPAANVGALRDDEDPPRDFENQKRFTPFTSVANMTGQPSVSLPFGLSDDGVPIGVMLTGRQAGEAALLSVAAQLEAARPGPFAVAGGRRPDCW